jgi:tRNA (cytidine/uridine-2'-O-)-methyltransferase
MAALFHIVFVAPEIPGNTGNAIRLAACTGASLHLVEPLGFSLEDAPLRRAGLDYHDLANVSVHADLDAALARIGPTNVYAFTTSATTTFTDISYQPGDALLFGRESIGLDPDVLERPEITERVRIPMLGGRRSLNLSNCAALGAYEAWRQHGFEICY